MMSDSSDFSDSSDDGEDTQSEDIFVSESDTSDINKDDTSFHPLQSLETEWSSSLDRTQTPPFCVTLGPHIIYNSHQTAKDFFELIFYDRCIHVLTERTNKCSREIR